MIRPENVSHAFDKIRPFLREHGTPYLEIRLEEILLYVEGLENELELLDTERG